MHTCVRMWQQVYNPFRPIFDQLETNTDEMQNVKWKKNTHTLAGGLEMMTSICRSSCSFVFPTCVNGWTFKGYQRLGSSSKLYKHYALFAKLKIYFEKKKSK